MRCALLAWLLAAMPATGNAQVSDTSGLQALLYARDAPIPATVKDLDATWLRMTVTVIGKPMLPAGGGLMGALLSPESGARTMLCYSRGKFADIGGARYLIAYRPVAEPVDLAALAGKMKGKADVDPVAILEQLTPRVTASTPLGLTLLNMRSIIRIAGAVPFSLTLATGERLSAGRDDGASVATLAAVLFPVFAQAREKAQEASSVSNLRQLGLGAMMYSMDHDEKMPPLRTLEEARRALMPYLKNEAIFSQPGSSVRYGQNAALDGKRLAQIRSPASTILFYEAAPGLGGSRAVVFVDGQARRLDASQWERLKRLSGIP